MQSWQRNAEEEKRGLFVWRTASCSQHAASRNGEEKQQLQLLQENDKDMLLGGPDSWEYSTGWLWSEAYEVEGWISYFFRFVLLGAKLEFQYNEIGVFDNTFTVSGEE